MSRKKHVAHRPVKQGAVQVSRARKQCEALGANLVAVGAELLDWDEAREEATELYRASLVPLDAAVRRGLREQVLLLDHMHASAELEDEERDILSGILADMASRLLDAEDEDEEGVGDVDPELFAIWKRHRDDDVEDVTAFDESVAQVQAIDLDSQENRESLRAMIVEGAESALALVARAGDKLEQFAARRQANLAHLQQAENELAAELRAALHGAQAMDEAARSGYLLRIDAAQAQDMLADLMAVGCALEQDGFIAHFPEKRLAGYKQLLKEALELTERELAVGKAITLVKLEREVPPERVATLTPDDLLNMLDIVADALRADLAGVERDLAELRDPHKLKAWLRPANGS